MLIAPLAHILLSSTYHEALENPHLNIFSIQNPFTLHLVLIQNSTGSSAFGKPQIVFRPGNQPRKWVRKKGSWSSSGEARTRQDEGSGFLQARRSVCCAQPFVTLASTFYLCIHLVVGKVLLVQAAISVGHKCKHLHSQLQVLLGGAHSHCKGGVSTAPLQ